MCLSIFVFWQDLEKSINACNDDHSINTVTNVLMYFIVPFAAIHCKFAHCENNKEISYFKPTICDTQQYG